MLNEEIFDHYIAHTRTVAEDALTDGEEYRTAIGVIKDERVWLWVFPDLRERPDKEPAEVILEAVFPCIVGMEADTILMSGDSYTIKSTTDSMREIDGEMQPCKRDGTPWGHGDMAYAREHNTVDAQDVLDTIMVHAYDRDGSMAMCSNPYRLEDGKLIWLDEETTKMVLSPDEAAASRGTIPDNIREMFTFPTAREQMFQLAELEGTLDPDLLETARMVMSLESADTPRMTATEAAEFLREHPDIAYAHAICAVIKVALIPQRCAIALAVYEDSVVEVFRESLRDIPADVHYETFLPEEEEDTGWTAM